MPSGREASLTKEKVTFGTDVKKLGFDVFWEAEVPSITTVKPGSEGESRGVLPGDIIAEVNGLDTKGKKKDELLPLLKARPLELLLQREKHTEVEDEGSSSDDEEQVPQKPAKQSRCKEDLALLAGHAAVSSSRPRAAAGVTAVKGAPLKEHRRKERQEEITGEDSAEEEHTAPASEAVAKRFDADMGVLQQQHQRLVKASYVTGPDAERPGAGSAPGLAAAADRTRKDSEVASRLQAELDAEAAKEKAPAAADDEAIAKTLQADYDAAASRRRAKEEEEEVRLEDLEGRSYEQEASMPLQKLLDVKKAEAQAEREQQAEEEVVELGLEEGAEATEDVIESYEPFTLQVIVPPDAEPGSLITVQAPNGLLVQAAVPNVPPGSLLYIHVNPDKDAAQEGQRSPVESGGSPRSNAMDPEDDAKDGQQQADERVSPARGGDGSAAGEEGGAGGAGVAVGVPNLLSSDLQSRQLLDVWESRMRRLSTVGMTCSKVGRSGKIYRRTFWTSGGCLRMNGRFASAVPLTSIQAVYKDTCSSDFQKLASAKDTSSGTSFLRRSPKSNGAMHKELCCVLVAQDRVFSLIFDDMKERDDFAETVAWCIQQMRAPGPS